MVDCVLFEAYKGNMFEASVLWGFFSSNYNDLAYKATGDLSNT